MAKGKLKIKEEKTEEATGEPKELLIDEPAEKVIDGVLERLGVVKAEDKPEEKVEMIPYIGSPEWTPFVLSKLNPDELWNGCPTYEGLRRISYDLLGTITDVDIIPSQVPNHQNANHSCLVAKITIEHPYEFEWLGRVAGKTIRYSHIGDSFHGNGREDEFAWKFSSATCWTRVKASLLRDTFRLKYVYAKEELTTLDDSDSGAAGKINSQQIDGLDMMCSRINVNTAKFIRGVWKAVRKNDDTEDLNECPFTVAAQLFSHLNKWQQDPKAINQDCLGYMKTWKECFKCLK